MVPGLTERVVSLVEAGHVAPGRFSRGMERDRLSSHSVVLGTITLMATGVSRSTGFST